MNPAGFCQFAALAPHNLALAEPDGRHWSRGELCRESTRLALGLRDYGVKAGDRLLMSLPNQGEAIVIGLAAQYLEASLEALPAAYDPLTGQFSAAGEARLRFHTAPGTATGSHPQVLATIPGRPGGQIPYSQLLASLPQGEDLSWPDAGGESPAALGEARTIMAQYGIVPDSGQVHYCCAPLLGGDALRRALASLHFGHPVVLADAWSVPAMLHSIEQYGVSSCQLSRAQVSELLQTPSSACTRHNLSSTRFMFFDQGDDSSSRLRHAIQDWWQGPLHVCASDTAGNIPAQGLN